MAMIVPQFTFALMATLALQQIFFGDLPKAVLFKKLKSGAIACGAVLAILAGVYFSSSFTNEKTRGIKKSITEQLSQSMSQGKPPTPEVTAQATTLSNSFNQALIEDRKRLFGNDLLRLFLFVGLGAGIVWLGSRKTISPMVAITALTLLSFIDLISVASRYLNKEKYTTPEDYLVGFTPNPADLQIKQDTSYFRVFDQAGGDPFQDSRSAYFHNSIGGYSPAKLGLYNDLIEFQLSKGNMEVFNMLNTKYFITGGQGGQPVAQINPMANGPVWFVKEIRYVNNADEEMKALDSLQTKEVAVADKSEQSKITVAPVTDSTAVINLVTNRNDEITYHSKSSTDQFAVFSEIYYPNGWKAYIDGKETPIVKVNYALRGLNVPAGEHAIRFEFAPASYDRGNTISLVAGILSILALIACAFLLLRQRKRSY